MTPNAPSDDPTPPDPNTAFDPPGVQLHHRAAGLSNDFNALGTAARLLSGRLQRGGRGRSELIQAEMVVVAAEAALLHARGLRDELRGEASTRLDPEEPLGSPYDRIPGAPGPEDAS